MKTSFLFCCLALSALHARSQNINTWIVHPVVTIPDSLRKLSEDSIEWVVNSTGKVVSAERFGHQKYQPVVLPFDFVPRNLQEELLTKHASVTAIERCGTGYIVVFSGVHFSYEYWFSADGKQRYNIDCIPFRQFVRTKDELYILSTYRNADLSTLKKVAVHKGMWMLDDFYEMPSHAYAAAADDSGGIVIATETGLFAVDHNKQVTSYIDGPMWAHYYLFPNSVAVTPEFIYVGMHGGVVRCDVTGGYDAEKWLTSE